MGFIYKLKQKLKWWLLWILNAQVVQDLLVIGRIFLCGNAVGIGLSPALGLMIKY